MNKLLLKLNQKHIIALFLKICDSVNQIHMINNNNIHLLNYVLFYVLY